MNAVRAVTFCLTSILILSPRVRLCGQIGLVFSVFRLELCIVQLLLFRTCYVSCPYNTCFDNLNNMRTVLGRNDEAPQYESFSTLLLSVFKIRMLLLLRFVLMKISTGLYCTYVI
jgi:hypothetical protein